MLHAAIRDRLLASGRYCLDGLLPRHCALCGQAGGPGNLCSPCRKELPRPESVCQACALPIRSVDPPQLCGQCLRRPPPWTSAVAALDYRYPVDRLVCRFKFGRDFPCGYLLGLEMLDAIRHRVVRLPDMVVPVPLHRWRHFARAFNQADLLARLLGRALGIRVESHLLSRVRRTRAQSGLDAKDRKRNIRGAFHCKPRRRGALAGVHIALVDDVLTTGATLTECSKTLKNAGVGQVTVWVAARAPEARGRLA